MTANGLTTMFLGEKKNRTSKAALLNLSFSRAACLPFAIILLCGRVETNSINPVSQGKVTGQKPCIHAGLSRFDGYSHSLILIGIFSVTLRLLPSTGMYTSGDYTFSSLIQHLILPAIAAGAMTLGIMTRMVRSSVSEMRSRSFVTTLRAKGLSEPAIMRHVLRNSFPTLLTVAGLQFGYLMGGSTMVETIFSWPGIGLIIYQSIFTSDFPVTQAAILIVAAIFVSINLLIDLLRIVADPRLRK